MEVHGKFAFMLVSTFDVLKSTLSDIRKKERNPLNMTHKNELGEYEKSTFLVYYGFKMSRFSLILIIAVNLRLVKR